MQGSKGVNSYDEWTTLQEVIVGSPANYVAHDVDTSFRLFYYDNFHPAQSKHGRRLDIPGKYVDELQEDVAGFVHALQDCGVVVHRPNDLVNRNPITSPFWSTQETPPLNIRDQTIILGDLILETAPHIRSRYFENDYLKPVFYQYFMAGSRWLSMPRPTLAKGSLDPGFFTNQGIDLTELMDDLHGRELSGIGHEIIFDGAQCIRIGRDVLVNVANKNHALAFSWMQRNLPNHFRFHRLNAIADSHIDSIVVPLRPGLLLLRSPEYLPQLPAPLQRWDVIYPPEVPDSRFPNYDDFDINLTTSTFSPLTRIPSLRTRCVQNC
jgi:glycine amidinotransferase